MIALVKLIIVLVLSVFSGEPTKEVVTEKSQQVELIKEQKVEKLNACLDSCIAV